MNSWILSLFNIALLVNLVLVCVCVQYVSRLGEISSDLYRFVQCDIKKCAVDSLKLEQNPQNCD